MPLFPLNTRQREMILVLTKIYLQKIPRVQGREPSLFLSTSNSWRMQASSWKLCWRARSCRWKPPAQCATAKQ